MTLIDYEELSRYSYKHPPVHLLLAGFVGYKAADVARVSETPSSGESLPLQYQIGGIPGIEFGSLPPELSPTFDPDWLN